jgi:hypothetical protein
MKTFVCTFMISRWLLRMKNALEKHCRENQNAHVMLNNFFFPENRAVCEIMWKNMVEPDRLQMTACALYAGQWRHRHTSAYVMHVAFPCQQWLRERASLFRYGTLPILFHCCLCKVPSYKFRISNHCDPSVVITLFTTFWTVTVIRTLRFWNIYLT